jgi:hypothetical protein
VTLSAESQEILALRLSGRGVAEVMISLHRDVDVAVLFNSAPAGS